MERLSIRKLGLRLLQPFQTSRVTYQDVAPSILSPICESQKPLHKESAALPDPRPTRDTLDDLLLHFGDSQERWILMIC